MEPRTCAARKDSAVHVSLSSYSPIKQPGASHPISLDAPESLRSSCHRPKSVTNHRKSEELRGRAIPPSGGAPCVGYICSTAGYCQPRIFEFFIRSSSTDRTRPSMLSRAPDCCSQSRSSSLVLAKDPCRRTLAIIVRRPAARGNTGHVVPASLHDQTQYTIGAIYDRRKKKIPR
jgi:hypothetical protein